MQLTWEKTKTGHVARVNGLPVAQATKDDFDWHYVLIMLLPYDGVKRTFSTLEDCQAFIVTDLLHTINLLIK